MGLQGTSIFCSATVEICGASLSFAVLDHGMLRAGNDIFARVEALACEWDECAKEPLFGRRIAPCGRGTCVDWFCFLTWLNLRKGLLWRGGVADWPMLLLRALSRLLAYGVERFIYYVYMPRMNGWEALAPLRAQVRSRRMATSTRERIMRTAYMLGGSSRTAVAALSNRLGEDWELTHKLVHLNRRLSLEAMRGSRRISVAWDPATYSGKSFNVGVMYSLDKGVATNLLPKARQLVFESKVAL